VEDMDMVEERLSNQPEVEDIDMMGNHMYEEVDMDMTNERLSNRPGVETMDIAGNHTVDDTMMDLVRVERVHGGMVMVEHHSDDAMETNRQTHREQYSGLEDYHYKKSMNP
jgi:hypothetical protein